MLSVARIAMTQESLQLDDDLWDAGFDSLTAVEVTQACSEAGLGDFDPTMFMVHRTAAAIAEHVRHTPPQRQSASLLFNESGNLQPIHCISAPAGTALAFGTLIDALPRTQPIVVIEPEGMHNSGRLARSIPEAGRDLYREVVRHQPLGPVILVAYSSGGVPTYECAHLLRREGREPTIILIDAYLTYDRALRSKVVATRRMGQARPSSRLRELRERLRYAYYNRTVRTVPAGADRYRLIGGIAARARRRYRPAPAQFPITLLQVADSGAAATWSSLAPQLTVIDVAGNHSSVLIHPYVKQVVEILNQLRESPEYPWKPGGRWSSPPD